MADTKSPKASSKSENASVKAEKKTAAKKDTAKKDTAKKPSVLTKIKQFFKDVRGETKKIVWNSKEDTVKNTGVVLMVTTVIGAGVWICDFLFRQLVELIYTLAGNGGAEAAAEAAKGLISFML